jgi:peptidoglycan/xylan/chitin deacetylase (PgdA/CDA1 family)
LTWFATPCVRADIGESRVATWYQDAAAAYTLTADDCRASQVLDLEPAWSQRGLKGTFFVNAHESLWCWQTYGDAYATFPQRGHEIGSHTRKHYSVIVNDPQHPTHCMSSLDELDQDCREFNALLKEMTGLDTVTFAYPWGRDDADSRAVIADHYLSARDVANYREVNGVFVPNPPTPPDMHKLNCFICAGTNPWWPGHDFSVYETATAIYAQYITDTIAAGGWAIEFLHGLDPVDAVNKDAYFEHLDALSALAAEGTIWNATQGDVSRYIYSRDAAVIELLRADELGIELVLDDGLDDTVFNVPLTVTTRIPEVWLERDTVLVLQGGTSKAARLFSDEEIAFASFEVLADGVPALLFAGAGPDSLLGDVDGDGFVGSGDLDTVRFFWGEEVTPGDYSRGDLSGDGRVGSADLDIVRACWGNRSHSATVPEPSTWMLLLVAAGLWFACRRAHPSMNRQGIRNP